MENEQPSFSIPITNPDDECRDGVHSITETSEKHQKLSNINILTLLVYGVTQLIGGLTNTILAPFYTKKATEKGIPVWQTGLVFSSMFITNVIFCPIFGKYLAVLGSKRLFLCGTILAGITHILFGLLEFVEDSTTFLALSFAIRIVSAIGESAFFAAIYYLTAKEAPKAYESTVLSFLETLYALGQSIGPFMGGILYDLQGFYLPLAICGSGLLIVAMISIALMCHAKPSPNEDLIRESQSSNLPVQENTTYWQLIKMPGILLCFFTLLIARLTTSWYLPSLQPFLEEHFQFSPTMVGVMFMIDGFVYAIFNPVGGLILDKTTDKHIHMLLVGAIGAMIGFSLLGPAPFLTFLPKNIYIVGLGLTVGGAFVAMTFIATLMYSLKISVADGAADTEQTQGMVISLWLDSQYIACYLGTAGGGAAYDALGFEYSTLIVIGLQITAIVAIVVYHMMAKTKIKTYFITG